MMNILFRSTHHKVFPKLFLAINDLPKDLFFILEVLMFLVSSELYDVNNHRGILHKLK